MFTKIRLQSIPCKSNALRALARVGTAQYAGQLLSILFLWHLSPQINNSSVCTGKACMDTRNYNTNSTLGIYTPAPRRIYDKVSKRSGGRESERGRETNNTSKSD